MTIMKKRLKYILCIAAVVATGGCAKEPIEPIGPNRGKALTGYMADGPVASRSALWDNQTAKRVDLTWVAGDEIGVFGSQSGRNTLYKAEEVADGGKTALFATESTPAEGEFFAYHPWAEEATMNGGVIGLSMPAVQVYTQIDEVSQPYAPANIMAGKGDSKSGIAFRNLFAVLRIGFAPENDDDAVKKVEFTDLSGKPVSGGFTVSWNGDIPETAFPSTGSGDALKITLDCGDGVATDDGVLRFFMIVPAREYPAGFKVTFVMDSTRVEKTVGTSGGKTLQRNGVYNIGDLPEKYEGIEYTLKRNTTILTGDRMDEVVGMRYEESNGRLFLTVNKAFNPQQGEKIVINETSEALPNGFAGDIMRIDGSDLLEVELWPLLELTDVFEELSIGEQPIYNADGTINEEGGVAVDLASYITGIKTINGEIVPFTRSGSTLNMSVPVDLPLLTRAKSFNTSTNFPNVSYTFKGADTTNLTVKVGVQLSMAMHISAEVYDGELLYIHSRIDPTATYNIEFETALNGSIGEEEIPLLEVHCAAIPVGPLLVVPFIRINAVFGAGGKIALTTKMEYRHEMMSVGFSYTQGSFLARRNIVKKEQEKKSPWDLEGKIQFEGNASFGVKTYVGMKIWGVLEGYIDLDTRLKALANFNWDFETWAEPGHGNGSWYNSVTGSKFATQFEAQLGVGLYMMHGWVHGGLNLDPFEFPIWEAMLLPRLGNFAVSTQNNGELSLSVDVRNNLLYEVGIGADIYEYNNTAANLGPVLQSINIGKHKEMPAGSGDNAIKLTGTGSGTFEPLKRYSAFLTVELPTGDKITTGYSADFSVEMPQMNEFRQILKDVYLSAGGTEWNDNLFTIGLEGCISQVDWMDFGYNLHSDGIHSFNVSIKNAPGTAITISNHPITNGEWSLYGNGAAGIEKIEVQNDHLTFCSFSGFPNLREADLSGELLNVGGTFRLPGSLEKLTIGKANVESLLLENSANAPIVLSLDLSGNDKIKSIETSSSSVSAIVFSPDSWGKLGQVNKIELKAPKIPYTTPVTIDLSSNDMIDMLLIENRDSHYDIVLTGNPGQDVQFKYTNHTATAANISITKLEGIINIYGNMENITISESQQKEGEIYINHLSNEKRIESLSISNCGSTSFYFHMANIQVLNVSGCDKLTYLNILGNPALGGPIPEFMWQIAERGYHPGVDWRYRYEKSAGGEWTVREDKGYGYYLYNGEPGNVDDFLIDEYIRVRGYN